MVRLVFSRYSFFLVIKTYIDLIIPAVRGTTSILNSALKHGSAIKRLILTSSVAAVREETTVPRAFNESNWNDSAVEAVKTRGSEAGPVLIYLASKTLAEKAAWEFIATHKSEISWDLVVLNPPLIFGARFSFCIFVISQLMSPHAYYSLRLPPPRQLMTSIPLSVNFTIPCLAREQPLHNYKLREIGST